MGLTLHDLQMVWYFLKRIPQALQRITPSGVGLQSGVLENLIIFGKTGGRVG